MSEKKENVYVGSGIEREVTGKGVEYFKQTFNFSINFDKIQDYVKEYKGHKFVPITVVIKKEKDQYGKDIAVMINQYEPENKDGDKSGEKAPAAKKEEPKKETASEEVTAEDLPFN